MAGTMSQDDLVADLKGSLHDAVSIFTAPADEDFARLLAVAARDMGWVRPRTLGADLSLTAGKAEYFAPPDMVAFKGDRWGCGRVPQPWESNYPGRHPRVRLVELAGVRSLVFEPAPTALQISLYGAAYPFYYLAAHAIDKDATKTTLQAADRGLLLLRAQAEAMREMALRNSGKPVTMRDGLSGQARNSTPAALFEVLMDEWRTAARSI